MNSLPQILSSAVRRITCLALWSTLAVLALASLSSGPFLKAQTGRDGLITQPIKDSDRFVLAGNTHPLATRATDRGPVPPSMPAQRMILLLRRSPEQELALRSLIQAMHDSNSPSFHKWLTPEQFGEQWGAADSDIAAVTSWLQSYGFEVKGPSVGRTAIEFSGTAGQIQEAFHTTIHTYLVNGEVHYANASDPQIPSALAPVVAGISSLNDFRPKSMAKKAQRGIYDMTTHRARPELTSSGSFGNYLYVGPADAATIYNSPIKALNPAATGTTVDGTGASIGIIGDSNITLSQNANYRKIFGLAAKPPTVIIDGGTDPGVNGDAVEAYLDTQVANGIAPNAKVYLYTAADTALNYGLDLAILRAVNDNLADILNLSFGSCEGGMGQGQNAFYEGIWEQAAAQGQSVTVSTGDSGSAGCDDPNTQTLAYYGLQVNGLASTPFNIAVGGTDFGVLAGPDGSGTDFTNYVSTSSDPKTLRSALGYIPEVPWNDSASTYPPGPYSSAVPEPAPYANIVGGGGGKSNCIVSQLNGNNLICDSGYPKPSWQVAPGVPVDKARDVPDVALFASNGFFYASWGICIDKDTDSSGNPIQDCTPGSNGLPANEFYIYGVGGTSASAPAFAGILALIRQSTGERQGQADYVLYNLARTAPSIFHDVVTGNNSVPCSPGTTNCSKNAAGSDYLTGYNAGVGYDLASGLGSVNVSALIANWASAGLSTTSTALSITPTSFEHGTNVMAKSTVTTASGIATGDVALSATANPPTVPLAKAIGTYVLNAAGSTGNIDINYLPGGSYKVIASYGGSEKFSQSVSVPVSLTVSPESSTTLVGVTAYNPVTGANTTTGSLPYGFFLGFTAQPYGNHSPVVHGVVEPDGVPTGSVAFSANASTLGTDPVGYNGIAESIGHNLTPATYKLSAAYSGDNSFKPSVGARQIVVSKGETAIKLAASATKYNGTPIVFTVNLTTLSIADAPTGIIALMAGKTVIAEGKLEGTAATSTTLAAGTATISTSNLPSSNSAIEAVYLGDVNYAASTSNAIEVTGKPTFVISNIHMGVPGEHATGDGFIPVVSKGGYAGTINLSCALISKTKAAAPPECVMLPASITLTADGHTSAQIIIFGKGTKLPTTKASNTPAVKLGFGVGIGAGAAALACCLFFGVPARRKGWRSMIAVVLLLVALGGFTACATQYKIITSGVYVFKVTGVDSKDSTNTASSTVEVSVY